MTRLFQPILRAVSQLDDRVFVGVLVQSLIWSALAFAAVLAGSIALVNHYSGASGWIGWTLDILGGVGAALLAVWLFFPLAAVIGTLFIERVARAVERRFYPALEPASGAPLAAQIRDGLAVGARILLLNALAIVLALLIPGIGLVLAWAIGAYAIGRGLFVAVAMRRMSRPEAEAIYLRRRLSVWAQGGILALAGTVPLLNLLIPVVGTAAMVHLLDMLPETGGAAAQPKVSSQTVS